LKQVGRQVLCARLGNGGAADRRGGRRAKPAKRPRPEISERDARKAAAEFEKEQKRREAERRREEAAREKDRERREKATARAQAALDKAEREHAKRPRRSRPRLRLLRSARAPRTTGGKRKENGCRLRSVVRGSRPGRVH
jgi:hypothetical protein